MYSPLWTRPGSYPSSAPPTTLTPCRSCASTAPTAATCFFYALRRSRCRRSCGSTSRRAATTRSSCAGMRCSASRSSSRPAARTARSCRPPSTARSARRAGADAFATEIPAATYETRRLRESLPQLPPRRARGRPTTSPLDRRAARRRASARSSSTRRSTTRRSRRCRSRRCGISSTSGRDRYAELAARAEVAYVFIFENRGKEIGVTLTHPHGQIYAFPFVPPRVAAGARGRRPRTHARTGRCLQCDIVAEEIGVRRAHRRRASEGFVAYVPFAARAAVRGARRRRRRTAQSLLDLDRRRARRPRAPPARACRRSTTRLWGFPMPYTMSMHQRATDGVAARRRPPAHRVHAAVPDEGQAQVPRRRRDRRRHVHQRHLAGGEGGGAARRRASRRSMDDVMRPPCVRTTQRVETLIAAFRARVRPRAGGHRRGARPREPHRRARRLQRRPRAAVRDRPHRDVRVGATRRRRRSGRYSVDCDEHVAVRPSRTSRSACESDAWSNYVAWRAAALVDGWHADRRARRRHRRRRPAGRRPLVVGGARSRRRRRVSRCVRRCRSTTSSSRSSASAPRTSTSACSAGSWTSSRRRCRRRDHALLIDCRTLAYEHVPLRLADARAGDRHREQRRAARAGRRARTTTAAASARRRSSLLRDAPRPPATSRRCAMSRAAETRRASTSTPMPLRRARHVVREIAPRRRGRRGAASATTSQRSGELMVESHLSLRDDYEVSSDGARPARRPGDGAGLRARRAAHGRRLRRLHGEPRARRRHRRLRARRHRAVPRAHGPAGRDVRHGAAGRPAHVAAVRSGRLSC